MEELLMTEELYKDVYLKLISTAYRSALTPGIVETIGVPLSVPIFEFLYESKNSTVLVFSVEFIKGQPIVTFNSDNFEVALLDMWNIMVKDNGKGIVGPVEKLNNGIYTFGDYSLEVLFNHDESQFTLNGIYKDNPFKAEILHIDVKNLSIRYGKNIAGIYFTQVIQHLIENNLL